LDRLIRDGPPDDDVATALTKMRFKVLDQGIKTDMDGMVRSNQIGSVTSSLASS
jgi:cell cycle arrest protein BUB2